MPIRIGTWNVEYARPSRLAALRQVLDSNQADVWVLTETHDDLAPTTARFHAHSEPRPRESPLVRDCSRWVTISSRYPIVRHHAFELADPERTVVAVIQVRPDKQLLVYGTVMPWKGDRGRTDHNQVIAQQCAEWLKLREAFPNTDLCVAGDYNTDMGTGSFYGSKAGIAALKSGLAACHLYCATEFDRVLKGMLPDPPIDHIAIPIRYREYARVVACWNADKSRFSDHSGLILEIEGF